MNQLSSDLNHIESQVTHLLDELQQLAIDQERDEQTQSLRLSQQAMSQLMDILHRLETPPLMPPENSGQRETDPPLKPTDRNELSDYALQLFASCGESAYQLQATEIMPQMEMISADLALWLARHDCELNLLEACVNALARLANEFRSSDDLVRLFQWMSEIRDAVSQSIQQDMDNSNPGRPWRLLLLNRGIVATRTHNSGFMEQAFDDIIQHLPNDAPDFFREGMGQMEALDYPSAVRSIMSRYYTAWCHQHPLH